MIWRMFQRKDTRRVVPAVESLTVADPIAEADRLRDAGSFVEAACAYRDALALVPDRHDLRIQLGNMLKDSGELDAAEAVYLEVLRMHPRDAEAMLQLGHLHKTARRRAAAIDAYRAAARYAPDDRRPREELWHIGAVADQEAVAHSGVLDDRRDGLGAIAAKIAALQSTLDQIKIDLPDIAVFAATPIGLYDRFRQMFDVPLPDLSKQSPVIAVLIAADRESEDGFQRMLHGVQAQSYIGWQLLVFGRNMMRKRAVERVALADPRIVWIEQNASESDRQAEERIAAAQDFDWLILGETAGTLHRHALVWIAAAANLTGATAFFFDSENAQPAGGITHYSNPILRHMVDTELLQQVNMCGNTLAITRDRFLRWIRAEYPSGIADDRWSLARWLAADGKFGHIPYPLVAHVVAADGAVPVDPPVPLSPAARPSRGGPRSKLAVLIATRDNPVDLEEMVRSLRATATDPAFEIVVIDNGSETPAARDAIARLDAEGMARPLRLEVPFNWSWLNNRAVEATQAEYLVFANDDMRMVTPGWDEHLATELDRSEVGAVGVRLLYEDDTIQHAGVLFGWNGATIHDGWHEPADSPGPCNRYRLRRSVSAVTGAFLAIRRTEFLTVGSFDERMLPIGYSDIDLCLKLRQRGLRILWLPNVTLYHKETKTRGFDDDDIERRARGAAERRVMEHRWGSALKIEPTANPTWSLTTPPFRLIAPIPSKRVIDYLISCTTDCNND